MDAGCRIQVLPPQLVKKIAAGEVVERPASVVKELLDNAIDSGADRVSTTVEDGGKKLIRVADNGCGMSAEELRLAVAPHSTSKLRGEEDLFAIESLGFRGEALASISSIAHLRLCSRRRGQTGGQEIHVVEENITLDTAAGCPEGTTVEVRDLFYNVPARRKFLKSNSTESGHVHEHVARAALAFPAISFELTNNKRVVHRLPATGERLERIAKLYSPELASAMLPVHREERGVSIEAYLAPPDRSRATAQWQYVFVNGRFVRDRFVQHAIKESYRGLIEVNRHAVAFVFLSVDPASLDVNVHPTKCEVRWADANLVHSQVLSALRESLRNADLSTALRSDRASPPISDEQADRMRQELAAVLKSAGTSAHASPHASAASVFGAAARSVEPTERTHAAHDAAAPDPGAFDPLHTWRALYARPDTVSLPDGHAAYEGHPGASTHDGLPLRNRPRAMQMHNVYLVAETDDGMMIVDQHALHERVMYEQLNARISQGPLESQRLLLPEAVHVSADRAAVLDERAELLEKLGIELSPFGNDTIAVQSFPSLLKNVRPAEFVSDLVDLLVSQPNTSEEDVLHAVLDMMACKAAVKAGDSLTPEEIDALLAKRHLLHKPSNCPHGRPTMLRFTKADLDRQFKRT